MALTITPYPGQGWTNDSEPDLSAETLNAVDAGITLNSEAINAIANAIVNQFLNDPEKIASAALVYALKQSLDATNSNLIKVYSNRVLTASIPGNTAEQTINPTLPQGTILALIPTGWQPSASWDTKLIFRSDGTTSSLKVRTEGGTSQRYDISYCVLYK